MYSELSVKQGRGEQGKKKADAAEHPEVFHRVGFDSILLAGLDMR